MPEIHEPLKLRRRVTVPETSPPESSIVKLPASRRGIIAIGGGNSGEQLVAEVRRLGLLDGYDTTTLGINNDQHAPQPFQWIGSDGKALSVSFDQRFVMGADGNPRDQIKEHPLLVKRYLESEVLRGISVFDTYNRGGRGGHSFPVITAMDVDRQIDLLYGFLRRHFSVINGERRTASGQSDLERLVGQRLRRNQTEAESWIILVVGGGTGSCGNALHQLLPYLIRHLLTEMGIRAYELWGVILGPRAFTGLTAYVNYNYVALLRAAEQMARHGQHRRYINGITIDTDAPPYDRLFLQDDPRLPRQQARVTEAELAGFTRRAAQSLHLLLNTNAFDVIASHAANPLTADTGADQRIRWLNTVNGATAGVDMVALREVLAANAEARFLQTFVQAISA